MSLCKDSVILVFDGVRADDGGSPEEVTLTITKYCVDPSPSYEAFVASYDLRLDTEFEFSPPADGSYQVTYTGNVTGIIETDDVLVDYKARNEIGKVAKADVKKLLCNSCPTNEYMLKKALLAMSSGLFGCDRFCEAEQFALDILDNCENNVGDCGCC